MLRALALAVSDFQSNQDRVGDPKENKNIIRSLSHILGLHALLNMVYDCQTTG